MASDPAVVPGIPEWTFGDRVRKIRRSHGLSQAKFAELIGRHEKSIAAWETGASTPPDIVQVAKRIELGFGPHGLAAWVLGVSEPGTTPEPSGPAVGPQETGTTHRDHDGGTTLGYQPSPVTDLVAYRHKRSKVGKGGQGGSHDPYDSRPVGGVAACGGLR